MSDRALVKGGDEGREGRNLSPSISSSGSTSPESDIESSSFVKFPNLPPEIRHQIWRACIPTPGINFFNIHSFPNDHCGANRSDSPNLLHLDVRRLDIEDDEEDVTSYDPSVWQARCILSQTCHEARTITAIAPEKLAVITLTRPSRGLYVRAGDGQLKRLTPLRPQSVPTRVEPQVSRKIPVHVDDVLSLSIENCSFSMPHEEASLQDNDGMMPDNYYRETPDLAPAARDRSDEEDGSGTDDDNIETETHGWAYDPQIEPPIPLSIPLNRWCINVARFRSSLSHAVEDAIDGLLPRHQTPDRHDAVAVIIEAAAAEGSVPPPHLFMSDAATQEVGERELHELTDRSDELFRDRWDDRYMPILWERRSPMLKSYRMTKLWPEKNDVRDRYLRSALLQSPKRPVRSS